MAAKKPLTETQLKAVRPRERVFKVYDAHSGLYLVVAPTGGRWWRVRLTRDGKEQHLSVGTYPEVDLDAARARAAQLRLAKKAGDETVTAAIAAELRGAERPHPVRVAQAGDSFKVVADRWIARQEQKVARSTFIRDERVVGYLVRELGSETPIIGIATPALRDAIQRIEAHGGEIARRALKLANAVWRYAMANGITDRNPCSGLKAQEILAPAPVQSFAAITEPKAFGGLLRAIDGHAGQPVVKIALQLLALTFVRPGELRLAQWSEFDFDEARPQWIIPRARMKMRESDHIVPLATQTVALLRELERHRRDDLAFPSLRPGRPLSDNTFNAALRALGYSNEVHVAHGFRSTASTLLTERHFDAELVETQLAHRPPGVRGIYMRAHLLEQRRPMMQSWADYLDELRTSN